MEKAEKGTAFKAYVGDPSIPIGERAQMHYRKAFALFEAIDHERSIQAGESVVELLAESKIPNEQKPYLEWVTAQEAEFFEAYHHIHHGHYSHSAMILRKIIDNPRRHKELVPKCYKELVLCYQHENDTLGAALAAEEYLILYPYRVEAEHFRTKKARLLGDHPEVADAFKQKREVLLAKYGKEPQDLKTALKDIAERKQSKIVVSVENGGRQ